MTMVPRPVFHFTPRRNWMNDPNGLVHHRGVWHLFFQHNPNGSDWGDMSWGHATSTDLMHWTEQPIALRYRDGEQIWSGSVVVSSTDPEQMTAIYTSAYDNDHQAQSRATSTDAGITWQMDLHNPILDRGTATFRDPKIIRWTDHEGRTRWVLLAVEAVERRVLFYSSDDLHTWTYLSDFGPIGEEGIVWECPDLIPLPLDDDPADMRWVLTFSINPIDGRRDPEGSSMRWVAGHFDGTVFTSPATVLTRLDFGRDYYAGVTFDNAPGRDAIMLGWMSNWRYAHAFPSHPWRGAMSLPRILTLRSTPSGLCLFQQPPAFITDRLAGATTTAIASHTTPAVQSLSAHFLLQLEWDPLSAATIRVHLAGDVHAHVEILHEPGSSFITITRAGPAAEAVHPDFAGTSIVPLQPAAAVQLVLSVDGPLLEIFVNGGQSTTSHLVVLGGSEVVATITSEGGDASLTTVDMLTPNESGFESPSLPAHRPASV